MCCTFRRNKQLITCGIAENTWSCGIFRRVTWSSSRSADYRKSPPSPFGTGLMTASLPLYCFGVWGNFIKLSAVLLGIVIKHRFVTLGTQAEWKMCIVIVNHIADCFSVSLLGIANITSPFFRISKKFLKQRKCKGDFCNSDKNCLHLFTASNFQYFDTKGNSVPQKLNVLS